MVHFALGNGRSSLPKACEVCSSIKVSAKGFIMMQLDNQSSAAFCQLSAPGIKCVLL